MCMCVSKLCVTVTVSIIIWWIWNSMYCYCNSLPQIDVQQDNIKRKTKGVPSCLNCNCWAPIDVNKRVGKNCLFALECVIDQ